MTRPHDATVALPPRSRRQKVPATGVAMVLAALILLALGALFGVILLGGNSDDVPPAPAAEGSAGTMSETAEPQARVRCWNDALREDEAACSPVRGLAGMRWLFPSLADDFNRCDSAAAYGGKVRAFGCTISTPGESNARVVYSEWRTFEVGDVHYRDKYGSPNRTDAQFNIWSTVWVSDNYQTSRMFQSGLPFSVTVASRSQSAATKVMNRLRFRGAAATDPYR